MNIVMIDSESILSIFRSGMSLVMIDESISCMFQVWDESGDNRQ